MEAELEEVVNRSKLLVAKYVSAAAGKSFQSCPTLRNPIDGSPPGSPVPGIIQARTLEWVAISFSNAWKGKVKVKSLRLSHVWLLAAPWTAAYQVPPSMGFSRREYWSGVPLPSPLKNLAFIKLSKGLYYPSCFSTWTYRCASNTGTRGGDYNLEWFIPLHDVHV